MRFKFNIAKRKNSNKQIFKKNDTKLLPEGKFTDNKNEDRKKRENFINRINDSVVESNDIIRQEKKSKTNQKNKESDENIR